MTPWTLFHTAPEVLLPDSDVLVYVFEPDRPELVDNEAVAPAATGGP